MRKTKRAKEGFFWKARKELTYLHVRSRLPENYTRKLVIIYLSYAMVYFVAIAQ